MTATEPSQPEPGPDASIDDIQADIEHTRQQLGETVEALSAKFDVTGRTKQKAADTKDHIAERSREAKDRVLETSHAVRSKGSELTSNMAATIADNTGKVKPSVPVAALAVVAAVVVGMFIWIRRR